VAAGVFTVHFGLDRPGVAYTHVGSVTITVE
jgi:hypothetical protein